jgi:hypothetical protein
MADKSVKMTTYELLLLKRVEIGAKRVEIEDKEIDIGLVALRNELSILGDELRALYQIYTIEGDMSE